MDLSSTTGNANPELLWLESVMVSRIDQFKELIQAIKEKP